MVALAAALLLAGLGTPALAQDPWPNIRGDFREGRFDAAMGRLESLIAVNPNDREAWYYVALIRWRQGRMVEASEAYRKVAALDPGGPFGQDATAWLRSYAAAPPVTPQPSAMATEAPYRPTPTPYAAPSFQPTARPTPPPATPAPTPVAMMPSPGWLTATPGNNGGGRPRSRNPRPGFFKALDGTFEFKPPAGFALLDEGETEGERRTLFGPAASMTVGAAGEQPPSLLWAWRDLPPGKPVAATLKGEAASYGSPVATRGFGGDAYKVVQRQGAWQAESWLFVRHNRLYAVTFGGDGRRLAPHRGAVTRSFATCAFYP